MPEASPPEIALATASETEALARRIAPHLGPGDTLLLEGPIGAGKTHFARAIIKARLQASGSDEDVPSPTFTLVQTYEAQGVEIWHADLYRLSEAGEIVELGLEDAFGSAICLVEWPDRLPACPEGAVSLSFRPTGEGDTRRLVVTRGAARWRAIAGAGKGALRAG